MTLTYRDGPCSRKCACLVHTIWNENELFILGFIPFCMPCITHEKKAFIEVLVLHEIGWHLQLTYHIEQYFLIGIHGPLSQRLE